MSDEDRDIDIESDEDDIDISGNSNGGFSSSVDKRAHHNALERKRRDHIKDSFTCLRDAIPSLHGEKVRRETQEETHREASRAQILNKATEYIQFMRRKNQTHQIDIEEIKNQNTLLEQQIRQLEKTRSTSGASMVLDRATAALIGGAVDAASAASFPAQDYGVDTSRVDYEGSGVLTNGNCHTGSSNNGAHTDDLLTSSTPKRFKGET